MGSVGVPARQHRRLLGEGFARAVRLIAPETSDSQVDHGLPPRDWQIAEPALVAAVERFRPTAALRAACACRFAADSEVYDLVA